MTTNANEGGSAREEEVVIDSIVGPGAMVGRRHGAPHVKLDAQIAALCERDRRDRVERLQREREETGGAAKRVLAPGEK